MKTATFKRLTKEDFDEQYSELIDQLGFILNNDIEGLYNILSRNTSLADNILCTVKDVPVIVDENGFPTNSATFAIDNKNMRVRGCQVIKAINTTNSNAYPLGAPFISFTPASSQVKIDHVTGLQPGQNYTLTIIAWGL